MAEALVSGLIEELVSLAFQGLNEEVRLVKDVDEDVQQLKTNLEALHAVLEDAERRQFADQSVRRWMDRLKDVSFDMDNVLDEWSTAILKLKIDQKQQGEHASSSRTSINEKVCLSIPSPFSCFKSQVNRITLRHDIAHKIQELNKKLDRIAREKDMFKLSTTTLEQPMERPRTTSFVIETDVFGRDNDKDKLVSRLLAEDSCTHQDQNFNIIPIIGMGGMGKTTLAQLVYNDEKVKAHFDFRIWVCVSEPFEVIKIAKAIVESIIEDSAPNINELENLLQYMRKRIEGKRYLLILDDVWTEDRQKWELLRIPLKCGGVGSRILVTTRKKEVAVVMEVAAESVITLEELSEEHCWSIFKKRAFFERNEDECRVLEEVGQKIARKAKGSPLVAKILGSLMCFKKTKTQWEDVLSSELWQSKDFESIFTPFFLSYYDLSAKEKRCFSYCSIFPKDYEFARDELVEMWMSQSFVGCGSNSKEGHDCFETLVMRSFFQDFIKDGPDGVITRCKMHDIVHNFAQFLTSDECVTLVVDDNIEEKLKLLDEKARHLCLEVRAGTQVPVMKYKRMNQKNLRSLLVLPYTGTTISVDASLFSDLVFLRTLTLRRCGIKKLPKSISNLLHLRYLNLVSNGELEELPETLCDLCNLQTLDLSCCVSLSRLPERMDKLLNLKHLYLRECFKLKGLSKGIGDLTCLQTLDMLTIPSYENKNKGEYFNVEDLEKMKSLQFGSEFRIKDCGNIKNVEDAKKIDLKKKDQISSLTLDFGSIEDRNNRFGDDIKILEALEPHTNLKNLCIDGFMGASLSPRPKWLMSLVNLKQMWLYSCVNCEILPSFGKLPVLEMLFVSGMNSVKKLGLEFYGIEEKKDQEDGDIEMDRLFIDSPLILFPKLERIYFDSMEQLEKWEWSSITSTIRIMPCLMHLYFWSCPSLQELPQFLQTMTSLKQLSINDCEIMEEHCQKRTSKEWDKISHIPNIEINHEFVRKDGIWIEHEGSSESNINDGVGTSSSTN
ncbi:putative disease resistance protein RGA3 [Humulus lupulus]|uniref:putative disease resistance protein RGA3 n=1 Tax=Humulus lupulus TaxID=3486 RepID=UPI002B407541|nr:putative disease resistance protein RGA3 [Humulus lupulus]